MQIFCIVQTGFSNYNVFMKKALVFFAAIFFSISLYAQNKSAEVKHNPWELIIYRPENSSKINEVPCWIKIEDAEGKDVTYTCARATYEWASIPDRINYYEKSWYLTGGMAMHLHNLKPGRYKFTFYTPKEKQYPFTEFSHEWKSNEFYYNTENPAKVIFVYPTANDNGFYNGGWIISAKAPAYFKFTKPEQK